MTVPLDFRPAQPSDAPHGARLLLLTLHQFGDYLFGFGDRPRALSALAKFFSLPANRFSHRHVLFLQQGSDIAGFLMLFDRSRMRRAVVHTAAHLPKVYSITEILQFLKLMLPYRAEEQISADELYIAHLAVDERFRRRGYGLRLLRFARDQALAQGKRKLSLLTEIENEPARALYTRFGFKVTDTIRFPAGLHYVGSAGDVRMELNL